MHSEFSHSYFLRRICLGLCGVIVLVALCALPAMAQDETLPKAPLTQQEQGEGQGLSPSEDENEQNEQSESGRRLFDGLKRLFRRGPSGEGQSGEGRSYGCAPTPEQLEELYKEYEML